MIKVLIVEDSTVTREHLTYILESAPGIKVVGTANNGEEALEFLKKKMPDVITMDIEMPVMDGIETTRAIMKTTPLPIVIVSANWNPGEVEKTFIAMEAGAVAVIEKPRGLGHPDCKAKSENLIRTVRLMSEVKVIKRWGRVRPAPAVAEDVEYAKPSDGIRLVAIGASTGGPPALEAILRGLHGGFPVPVVIVQHITQGFIQGMAEWLEHSTGLPVHLASNGAHLLPGHVYLAPDNFQMGIAARDRIVLSNGEPENGLRPSVSYMFRSVANVLGSRAVGVLLTGMGRDGADELKLMRERGAATIAQDRASSIVYGMPGEAVSIGAAMYVQPPEQIAKTIKNLVAGDKKADKKADK